MFRGGSLPDLIGLAYDAAIGQQPWEAFLAEFAGVVGLDEVTVEDLDFSSAGGGGRIRAAHGVEEHHRREYEAYFSGVNAFAQSVKVDDLVPGFVGPTHELRSDRDLERTEYYQDWLRPQGLFYGIGGTVAKRGDHVIALTGMRARRHGPVQDDGVRVITTVLDHLGRSLEVESRLQAASRERRVSASTLDRLTIGVVVVGESGQVTYANPAAVEVLARQNGLLLTRYGLDADRAAEASALARCIRTATTIDPKTAAAGSWGGSLTISRRAPLPPLRVVVSPLGHAPGALGWGGARALILVEDPEREIPSTTDLLRRLFGLTPAEAAVAERLMRGEGLTEAAAALSLSRNTVKSHFRKIAWRTGVRRQVDLVRLLATTLGQVPFE